MLKQTALAALSQHILYSYHINLSLCVVLMKYNASFSLGLLPNKCCLDILLDYINISRFFARVGKEDFRHQTMSLNTYNIWLHSFPHILLC